MKSTNLRPPLKILCIILLLGVAFFIFANNFQSKILVPNQLLVTNKLQDITIKKLSLLLNQASNQIGKLSCKLNDDVSERGGWCSKISGKNSSQHVSDVPLANALSKYLLILKKIKIKLNLFSSFIIHFLKRSCIKLRII